MPRSVNKVILIGHLGKDAETRFTPNGTAVVNFSLATSRKWKTQDGEWKEETDWHRVTLWNGEKVANYLTKGKPVYIEGRIQTRSYEDKEGRKVYVTEIVAENLILLGGDGEPREQKAGPRPVAKAAAPEAVQYSDEDVPF